MNYRTALELLNARRTLCVKIKFTPPGEEKERLILQLRKLLQRKGPNAKVTR